MIIKRKVYLNVKMRAVETDLIVKYLCDGNIRFIKKHSKMRCDIDLFKANQKFLKTGIISKTFRKATLNPELKLTITTRLADNKVINDHFNPDGVKLVVL